MGKPERVNVVVSDFGPFPALADMSINWNGFVAAPMFDRETAARIVEAVNAASCPEYIVRMTIDDDGVWEWVGENADAYTDPRGTCYKWDADGLAPIGEMGWAWLVE